jgi:hypothetical protein
MDRVVDEFLAEPFPVAGPSGIASAVAPRRQIVSLGAGLDSRYFRLWQQFRDYNSAPSLSTPLPSGAATEGVAAVAAAPLAELPPLVVNGKVRGP